MPSLLLLRWRLFPLRDHRDPWRSRPKGVRDFKVRPTMRYTTRADRMSAGMRVSLHAKRNLSTVSKALLWVPLGVSVDTATCFFFFRRSRSPATTSSYQLLPATASYVLKGEAHTCSSKTLARLLSAAATAGWSGPSSLLVHCTHRSYGSNTLSSWS